MTNRQRSILLVCIQGALLVFEVATPYDLLSRRLALGFTNVLSTLGILLVARAADKRGRVMPVWMMLAAAAAVWLDAIGNFAGWYTKLWWWDRLTHATGGFALTILAFEFWQVRLKEGLWTVLWVALLTGQTIGAWYEISEFLGDLMFGTRRVGSGFDSPRDLWFNFVGGVLAMLLLRLATRRRKVV